MIVDTCEKIAGENASLFYLLTPSVALATPEDTKKIAQVLRWRTTSPEQDAIYNDAIKCSRQHVYAKERVIQIDEKLDAIIWPAVGKTIDRYIYLRPKNSPLNKHWVIMSKMLGDGKVSNIICEYTNGAKDCRLYQLHL